MEDKDNTPEEMSLSNPFLKHIYDKLKAKDQMDLRKRHNIENLLKLLHSPTIDFMKFRDFVTSDILDELPSLRSLCWKILLRALSLYPDRWKDELAHSRRKYKSYLRSYIKNQFIINNTARCGTQEHPLSKEENSYWNKYFRDTEFKEEIYKDIRRTRTPMTFFFQPFGGSTYVSHEKNSKAEDALNPESAGIVKKDFETNADVMARILFIFGKTHPEIKYVQGMNEILAPIFYTFSRDTNHEFSNNLEADSYTCFENIMMQIKDLFIKGKDFTYTGVQTRLDNLSKLIEYFDFNLYRHLKQENIELHFFAFKWITLLFTQDLEMPEILNVWDYLLCEEDILEFINLAILGILDSKSKEILETDFSGIMMILQSKEIFNAKTIIKNAKSALEKLNKKVKKDDSSKG